MSKEQYDVNESQDYNGHANAQYVDPATGIESKQGRITEAADVYGNIETAEEYGYVTRGFVHLALKDGTLRALALSTQMSRNTDISVASNRDISNSLLSEVPSVPGCS
jgi:hypothetical protein